MALRERLEAEINCMYFLHIRKFMLFIGHRFIMMLSASSVGTSGSGMCREFIGLRSSSVGDGTSKYCYNKSTKVCVQEAKRSDGRDYRTCFPWPEMCAWYCVSPNVCSLPKDSGDSECDAPKKLMYYFDKKSQTCELFLYNGCNGNQNRFEEMRRCEVTCKGSVCVTTPHVSPEYCDDPPVPERIQRKMEFYKYNPQTGSCQNSIFCNREGSNYKTRKDCERRCLFKKRP
uniref:Tissue factor pathway inhibitor n=1 Tax=Rhipicephalus appendiculatus TaxID=34631 RepID=A0A131YCL0_RHIAP